VNLPRFQPFFSSPPSNFLTQAQADWIQDATSGGQKVFKAAFDGWTE